MNSTVVKLSFDVMSKWERVVRLLSNRGPQTKARLADEVGVANVRGFLDNGLLVTLCDGKIGLVQGVEVAREKPVGKSWGSSFSGQSTFDQLRERFEKKIATMSKTERAILRECVRVIAWDTRKNYCLLSSRQIDSLVHDRQDVLAVMAKLGIEHDKFSDGYKFHRSLMKMKI